jgi:hypothetical protein
LRTRFQALHDLIEVVRFPLQQRLVDAFARETFHEVTLELPEFGEQRHHAHGLALEKLEATELQFRVVRESHPNLGSFIGIHSQLETPILPGEHSNLARAPLLVLEPFRLSKHWKICNGLAALTTFASNCQVRQQKQHEPDR